MKLNQAWGWLFAGVVAAGLNASYHDGGLQWAHRVLQQAGYNVGAVVALASGRMDQFATQARMVSARNETAPCRFATALARVQSKVAHIEMARQHSAFDRFEAMSARQEAQVARFEANRDRMEAELTANRNRWQARLATMQIPAADFDPVAFKTVEIPAACSRIRVSVPSMPVIKTPAVPVVHIDIPSAGPV